MSNIARSEEELVEELLQKDRSHVSNHKIKIQFINKYPGSVSVRWLDFSGEEREYTVLQRTTHPTHQSRFNVNTFVTHPWVFYDTQTQQRVSVQFAGRRLVVFEGWSCLQLYKARNLLDRTTFNQICRGERDLPVYIVPNYYPNLTLRQLCVHNVAKLINCVNAVQALEIPQQLKEELIRKIL